ncbi:hypothetical protein D3870_07170 [Noviherbaspirillum cavernae]|uniref:Glycine transferase n=1 Tax=Noviherbaspirillum cavernae TaxID=2320862 RepID=A0A418WZZ6_9BURK|nr:WbqC family protein [Noviherbaspirillum cavernae]RJG05828.1 hypothetical protein D3870_07170 [Noviherbaspirillum cavernae]
MVKKIGIMQPYLFPYLGYFQLIDAVDVFVLSDDLQYIRQGWINRNRILVQGQAKYIHIPIKHDSYLLNINERVFPDNHRSTIRTLLKTIATAYGRAPFFKDVFPMVESVMRSPERNLARYVENSIRTVCTYLQISTPILISSELGLKSDLRGQQRVIETVKSLKGDVYINPIGGVELYNFDDFKGQGIALQFHRMCDMQSRRPGDDFEPYLSIIDMLMFNSISDMRKRLSHYSLESNERRDCSAT